MVGRPSCNDGAGPSCRDDEGMIAMVRFICNRTAKRSRDVKGLKRRGVEGLKKEELVKERLQKPDLDVVGAGQVEDGGDGD